MSYHDAFEPTKTCRSGRIGGVPSIEPRVTTVISGRFVRRMNSCEPQREQKHLRRFGDDSYSDSMSAPDVMRRASVATTVLVEKAAPWALRHIEQWQCSANANGAAIWNRIDPQRQ